MTQNTKHKLAEQYLLAMRAGNVFPNYPLPESNHAPENRVWYDQRLMFRDQAQKKYPGFRGMDHGIKKYFQLTKNSPSYTYDRDKDTFDLIFPLCTLDSEFLLKKDVPSKEVYDALKDNLLETTMALRLYERLGRGAQKSIIEGIPPKMLSDMHEVNEENRMRFLEATRFDVMDGVTLEQKRKAFAKNCPQLFGTVKERGAVYLPSDCTRDLAAEAMIGSVFDEIHPVIFPYMPHRF